MVCWEECVDPFSGDGDLYITGSVEVKVQVNVITKMLNGSNVLKLGDKSLWINLLGGGRFYFIV